MTTNASTIGLFKVFLFYALMSNFSAFAQKTSIWIVSPAEVLGKQDYLSNAGQARAEELAKTLKREKIQAIYTIDGRAAQQTAAPLAQKAKLLPRVYADSIAVLADKIKKNFQGNKVLIIAKPGNIIPLLAAFGAKAPFSAVQNNDNDLLFALTLNENANGAELFISHYGKAQHSTEIPQQFILDNFYPSFVPPMNNH